MKEDNLEKLGQLIDRLDNTWVVGENVLGIVSWNDGLVFEEVQADLETEGYEVQPYVLPAAGVGAPHQRYRVWFVAYSNAKSRKTEERELLKKSMQRRYVQEVPGIISRGNATNATLKRCKEDGADCTRSEERTCGAGIERHAAYANQLNGDSERLCSSKTPQLETSGVQGRTSADTNCVGSQRIKEETQGKISVNGDSWSGFPTQSPVRGGDDEFSCRLDGIAFSKWRRESIKAYGNAVVPQVVMQIFRAIEQYYHKQK